jgi:heat shock protein HtpX
MQTIYTQKESNIRRTRVMFSLFFIIVIALGWVFSLAFGNENILIYASLFSIVSALVSYWQSDKIALSMARAQKIGKSDAPELWSTIENLAITAGLPMPRVYVTPEAQINAFATGRDPAHAAVAVTRGALERLDKNELQGVLAHELSHVGNRDILVSTVAVVLAGVISLLGDVFLRSIFFGGGRRRDDNSEGGQLFFIAGIVLAVLAPIGAMLIQLAISRRRESLADESGVLLTRYPEGLVSALRKIQADTAPMAAAKDSTAHLWIDNPFKGRASSFWHRLFSTHPPIEERIAALEKAGR